MKFLFFAYLLFASFPYPTVPVSGVIKDTNKNLIEEYAKESPLQFEKQNRKVLISLKKESGKRGLRKEQAEKIKNFLLDHPIAGDQGIKKYSGRNPLLGFCYGRATLAHVELLRRGVDAKNIRKIFVIGEMMFDRVIWELHVATIVEKSTGGWWVLDGFFNELLEVQDWYQRMKGVAINKKEPKIRIYVTDPVKFLPISGPYNEKDMYREEYNGFFKDLTKWLNENPVKEEDKI